MPVPVSPPPQDLKALDPKTLANWYASMRAPASTVAPPATAKSVGMAGQIAFDANFAYFCIATNTWKRVAITIF